MNARHHLLWLSDAGWARLQQDSSDAPAREVLRHWQQMRWPLIVRRADAAMAADEIAVGIALPPDAHGHKPRIALRVRTAEVLARRRPFLLRDIAAARLPGLPLDWQSGLPLLQQQLDRAGIVMAVFGSLAWQVLTAQSYVRSSSDIDLLFQPRTLAELEEGVRLLAGQAMSLPLDGEILFPGEAAVSWKEWHRVAGAQADGQGRVLVKRAQSVALETVAQLRASLRQAELQPCAA